MSQRYRHGIKYVNGKPYELERIGRASKAVSSASKGVIGKKRKGRTKSKNSYLKKLSKSIDSKIRKYKRIKRTMGRSKKTMSTGKGGLKIFKTKIIFKRTSMVSRSTINEWIR